MYNRYISNDIHGSQHFSLSSREFIVHGKVYTEFHKLSMLLTTVIIGCRLRRYLSRKFKSILSVLSGIFGCHCQPLEREAACRTAHKQRREAGQEVAFLRTSFVTTLLVVVGRKVSCSDTSFSRKTNGFLLWLDFL